MAFTSVKKLTNNRCHCFWICYFIVQMPHIEYVIIVIVLLNNLALTGLTTMNECGRTDVILVLLCSEMVSGWLLPGT